MGERERYEPGTFCWVDLGTVGAAAAKSFYTALFGWDTVDIPMGDAGMYTVCSLAGRNVCALYERGPSFADVPPAWLSYVSVVDADATVARARAAGAANVEEPIDVFDAGRMALIEDPTGAHVAAWQPKDNIGAGVVNVPGALTLNQLNTSDPDRAARFYADVFGWRVVPVGTDQVPYWGIFNGEGLNGGMMTLPPGAGPPHWMAYFATVDIDATAARVAELGGTVLVAPSAVPSGHIAVVADPQGAAFALYAGNLDP